MTTTICFKEWFREIELYQESLLSWPELKQKIITALYKIKGGGARYSAIAAKYASDLLRLLGTGGGAIGMGISATKGGGGVSDIINGATLGGVMGGIATHYPAKLLDTISDFLLNYSSKNPDDPEGKDIKDLPGIIDNFLASLN